MILVTTGVLCAGLTALWVAAAVRLERRGHHPEARGRWDALIVPGAVVRADGSPGGALARRTEHAVALWRAGVAPRVCFTGGPGTHGPAEAIAAAAHARAFGLPEDALYTETRSTSTEENAAEAAAVLGPVRVLVVTDSYHAFRCRRVFGRYFPEVAVATTRPSGGVALRMALREVLVNGWYAATGRLRHTNR